MFYVLLFISTIFMTSSLNAMEIIKKNKVHKKHTLDDSINKELLFVHAITDKKFLSNEITKKIILPYCAALKNKEFEDRSETFKETWFKDSLITRDYYFLTSQQKELMYKIITTRFEALNQIDYYLDSTKEYKLFLKLPIELRKNLTLLPNSIKSSLILLPGSSLYSNPDKTIQVKTTFNTVMIMAIANRYYDDGIPKPIIPEENEKKNHKKHKGHQK